MRVCILAHHVVPHQPVHEAFGLVRAEHLDLLFADINVVPAAQQRAAELRHKRNRRLASEARPSRIGIVPEGGNVDVDTGAVLKIGPPGASISSNDLEVCPCHQEQPNAAAR